MRRFRRRPFLSLGARLARFGRARISIYRLPNAVVQPAPAGPRLSWDEAVWRALHWSPVPYAYPPASDFLPPSPDPNLYDPVPPQPPYQAGTSFHQQPYQQQLYQPETPTPAQPGTPLQPDAPPQYAPPPAQPGAPRQVPPQAAPPQYAPPPAQP
ncbi:MAG: hypothetical protein JXB47_05125, partial [Anaerolineae bacterium]|nr:hypothetical protein [Anaerolineae bacterium]